VEQILPVSARPRLKNGALGFESGVTMVSFPGPLPYDVKQAYEKLLNELDDLAAKSNFGPSKVTGIFKKSENVANQYSFDCYLHLQRWKERNSPSKKRAINIFMHVQETILLQKGNYTLTHSTVRVSYFKVNKTRAILLHSIHFDHGKPEESHPIFHAQLSRDIVTLPDVGANELGFDFTQKSGNEVFKNARIPTSDMTLPSVVLCLAADHINAGHFCEFFKSVLKLQQKMPQPIFQKTKTSIATQPDHLRSSHWFAHMLEPNGAGAN
jgi:hypothetical protein